MPMEGSSSSFRHPCSCIPFLLAVLLLQSLGRPMASADQKVTVSLYYETLCPYCANFIVNSLVKVFDKGLISIVDLRLIPWGNGWIQPDGSLTCQHGPDECLLNTIEACAINVYPDVNRHFRFVYCIERLTVEGRHNEWGSCFGEAKVGTSPVDCYNRGNGYTLERRFADETARLNPPHRFVPWVVVDGLALQEDFQNFESYICRAYRGSNIPEACTSLPSTNDSFEENSGTSVCYVDKSNNSTSFRY